MPDSNVLPPPSAAAQQASTVLAPSATYLMLDDEIRVTAYNGAAGVTLEVHARIFGTTQLVQVSRDTLTPSTNRAASSQVVATDEGWLIGGEVFAVAGTPLIGQCYVVVEVVRGLASSGMAHELLAAGYVTARTPLRFPTPMSGTSLDGRGALRSITGTNPAAGVEILETVPTGARWRFLTMNAALTTSAVVNNRQVKFIVDDGANVLYRMSTSYSQVNSRTDRYTFAPTGTSLIAIDNTALAVTPVDLWLLAGYRLLTLTTLLDAGDDWGAPQYLVEEFTEPQ